MNSNPWIVGKASSYGDAEDTRRYRARVRAVLAQGKTKAQAEAEGRKVGDPGVGWMNNDITVLSTPWVAVPRDDWQAKYATKRRAHKCLVEVEIAGQRKLCVLGDTMPWRRNIRNGAVIDLAPGASALWGLKAPHLVPVRWRWVDQPATPARTGSNPPSPLGRA